MRLVSAAHRNRMDDLCIGVGVRVHVDGDELVFAIANALEAEGPDVDVVFLTDDFGHIRRHAGLVCRCRLDEYSQRDKRREKSSE